MKTVSCCLTIVCISSVIGHCSQFAKNSSVYPIRKYTLFGWIPRRIRNAIRMWLNCRLMITSLQTNEWKVPMTNFRMNKSSTSVWVGRSPSCKLALILNEKKEKILKSISLGQIYWCFAIAYHNSTNSMIFVRLYIVEDLPFHKLTVDLFLVWFYIFLIEFSNILPMHESIDWVPIDLMVSMRPTRK